MGKKSSMTPLHKNVFFLVLIGLSSLVMSLSLVLYMKLESMDDDDLILGAGGGDGLKLEMKQRYKRHKKKNKKKKRNSVTDFFAAMEPRDASPEEAIEMFRDYKEKTIRRLNQEGTLTPRQKFEQQHPPEDLERLKTQVQKLRQPLPSLPDNIPYNIYHCPQDPPPNYPFSWNVMDVLQNWNPDDTEIPRQIFQGLCVFDWNNATQARMAQNYRQHELPFVVHNFPEVMKAAERWSTPGYVDELVGDEAIRNEHSRNNHFMFWRTHNPQPDFVPPTDMLELTYSEWLAHAKAVEESKKQASEEHWYFRLNGMLKNHAYLYEELPFFDPTLGESLTMVTPSSHRGINCRFGMKGVIAESHFDSHNNFIAILGGQRRYILAHPGQCENMELYPVEHPSGRHSRIDWSKAYYLWRDSERPFVHAQVNEVVLQAGDLMYLPTFWFHFIVSLNINYQCNSRSGETYEYASLIDQCGFGMPHRG